MRCKVRPPALRSISHVQSLNLPHLYAVASAAGILGGELCPECQNEVIRIENGLANNATDQQIIDELEKLCNLLPTTDQPNV